jgi:hypothetical protein
MLAYRMVSEAARETSAAFVARKRLNCGSAAALAVAQVAAPTLFLTYLLDVLYVSGFHGQGSFVGRPPNARVG